ncbi:unnamed protein product [Alternaria burnsii]|nr:unnamed protein product [Alternaria burnsii]
MSSIASDHDDHSSATSSSSTSDEHETSPAEDVDPAPGTKASGWWPRVAVVIDPVVAEEEEGSSGDYGLQGKENYPFANEFDVVTIHGLHGHRETTWQARDESKRETVRGLKEYEYELDFRLMNYGYDAFKTLSKEGINKEASKLLRTVAEARNAKDKDWFRPIVFVCHDIGGTIVKQALYQSVMNPGYADIAESTKWIIFIGYPHRWHSVFDMEEKIARLLFSGPKLPKGNSLLQIKSLARAVIDCNLAFVESKILLKTEILSVRSTLTDLNQCIFNEFDTTLATGFVYEYEFPQPHAALASAEQISELKSMFEEFRDQLKLDQGAVKLAEVSSYMNALVAHAPPVRPILSKRYQRNPLVNNQQYINWRESTDSNVLIIHRQSPKPWLSGFVFEDIVKNSSGDGIRSYFSFDGGDDRYKDTRAFLSTMAAQWVRTKKVLKSGFDFENDMSRFLAQRTLTEDDLLLLLSRVRHFYSKGEMVFVLDNLDECSDKLSSFWRLAAEMSETREKQWQFLIMTKSIDSLDEWLKGSPTIVLEDEFSLEDVDPCVRDEIDYALHQLDARYVSTLSIGRYRDDLLRKCGNDVGLARLLVQDIQNSPSLDALTNALEMLPEVNLEVFFRNTMRAVPEAKRTLVARAITWLVFAFRPLSIGELRSVLGISESTQDADGMGAVNALTGIPIFDFSNPHEMRFQHAELKSLILHCDKEEWYHVQATAHEMMAEACLAFLGTTSAHDALNTVCEVRHGVLSTPCVRRRVDVPTYAVCYWDQHYRLASNKSRLTTQVVEFFKSKAAFRGWQMAHWFVSNPFSRVDRTYVCPLPLVASMGLDDVYERWIQDNGMSETEQKLWLPYAVAEAARNRHGSLVLHLLRSVELDRATAEYVLEAACSGGDEDVLVDVMSHIRKTAVPPFKWPAFVVRRAAWNGHAKVVQALMDEGADISGSEGAQFGQCSLYVAARNGHIEVVKLVAMHDESLVTARDEYNNSVLDAAALWGNANMVRLLLEKGAPPNADDGGAISSACSVGAHAALRVFLEHGVQTETKGDGDTWPPLHTAIQKGAWQCVQELLRFKSDANHECPGGTPLVFAVEAKRLDMVQLLVEHGADVNKRHDEHMATALQTAVSQEGGLAMMEWLVNKGADVNLRTPESSPLFDACLKGDVDMVRLLLDKGAKVNDVCSQWTPLHGAYRSADVTRLLLEAGASVDEVVAGSERSPLFLAAEWGQTDVVTVLVEHHADVNLPYRPADVDTLSGFTPLLAALKAGHGDTARVLLEAGADTSIKPASGIHPVLYMGTTDLLRMVLEFQPDLGLADRDGDTALNAALERDTVQLADMKLLVHAGSNVDTTNTAGSTPLHKAIDKDKLDIARFLLKRGANANALALNTGAPLHLACSKASPAAVRLLVDAGANVNLIASYHGSPAQAVCGRSLAVGVDEENDDVERTILEVLQCLDSDTATMNVNATGGLYGSALAACSYRATAPVLQFLLRLGATTDTCDQAGRYPIHLAAVRPTTANFAVLRDANANLYVRDNAGRTLVHFAIVSGNLDLLRCVLQATNGLLHAPDADGWTPLHYAARGTYYRHSDLVDQDMREQRKHEFVVFLIDQGADICALTVGPDGKQSSPLKLANYHGAKQETLHLLTPHNNVNNDAMIWDQISHQSKKAFDAWPTIYCDGCLYKVSGFRYKCRDCWDFDFCYKCYANRLLLHPHHEWNTMGQEFEDEPDAQSEAANQDSDSDDDDTVSDSDDSSKQQVAY